MHKRIILITNIPNPYRIPLFNVLYRICLDKGFNLKVFFLSKGYERRKWENPLKEADFNYTILKSLVVKLGEEKYLFIPLNIFNFLSEAKPNIIITSGFSFATIGVFIFRLLTGTPYIIWSGDIQSSKYRKISLLRIILRKILVKNASGFIAYGTMAREYLISLGVDPNKVEIAINTVDTEFFRSKSEKIRGKAGIDDNKKHLLYIGHLTKRKRVDRLLHVMKALASGRKDFVLDVVGSGSEMDNLKRLADELNISEFIKFEGFIQKDNLPEHLARAKCFLFPSEYDIWGLVLVEAMAAGLPCIASVFIGATDDLIKDGVNGFAMDFSETEKVVEKVNWILDNSMAAQEIGKRASAFIRDNVSIEKSAAGFLRAVVKADYYSEDK